MKADLHKLLIDCVPLLVLPELAVEVGIEASVVLQQLHWLLRDKRNGRVIGEHRWIYNTYEEWLVQFPWMSIRTIQRTFLRLEKDGYIESCQPEGGVSRRKYYRIKTS